MGTSRTRLLSALRADDGAIAASVSCLIIAASMIASLRRDIALLWMSGQTILRGA